MAKVKAAPIKEKGAADVRGAPSAKGASDGMTAGEGKAMARYAKEQLVRSDSFSSAERDILAALLDDEELYTKDQAREIIAQFKKREVV